VAGSAPRRGYTPAMPKRYQQAEQVIDPSAKYTATIATDRGDIVIALDPAKAPKSVNNFVFLARDGFYEGLTFHRVVDDFVIQGGDPEGSGRGGPGYRFDDEPVQGEYIAGAVAMANAGPNTNGSQFFICTVDDRHKLAKSYNLFGQVVKGMEVVGQIRQGDVMRSVTISEG
jgi:cyclophilin family peptidyl-prolyl cis-trans isomerase